ncbi:MAG: hypothetical protein JWM59_3418 [Verrucomicrobiales bacterium]|nr:hypothetical protein [Verrucomicrobiales bacterium]
MEHRLMNRLFAEFLGTFFLCTVALASRDMLAAACTLAIMTWSLGYLAAGNFNPAVTVALWLRGKMGKTEMLHCFSAQFSGALAGYAAFRVLGGAPVPGAGLPEQLADATASPPMGMVPFIFGEFLFTFLLASTVLHVTTARQLAGNGFFGAAIGLCLYAGSRCVYGLAAFNPALGLGLVLAGLAPFWYLLIYFVAGAAAGATAATVHRLLNPND